MTVVVSEPSDVNLDTLRRVALEGEDAVFSSAALERMASAHEQFQRYVHSHRDTFIYMVTAGAGPDAKSRYTLEQTRRRRSGFKPFLNLSFGGGTLPEHLSRATVFAQMATLASGSSATHPKRAVHIATGLSSTLPPLPKRGLTAAGEIMPRFVLRSADEPDIAGEGFSAGTGNGAQMSAAMAALTAIFTGRRLEIAEVIFALSACAFPGAPQLWDPTLEGLYGDDFDDEAARRLRSLLEGGQPRRGATAPLSYRLLARFLAAARRSLTALEDVATTALGEAASNPAFITAVPGGAVSSTGGFHNATAAPAIDAVSLALLNLASLAHRHSVKLHKGELSGLPDRLLLDGTDYMSGYSTTYLEYTPNQALEELRRAAQATLLVPAEIAASEQDDVAITAPVAYNAGRQVAACFDEILAVLAVSASQAIEVAEVSDEPVVPPGLSAVLARLRQIVPPVRSRRELGEECGRLAAAISAAVEEGTVSSFTGAVRDRSGG